MDISAAKMIGAGLALFGAIGAGIGLGMIFSAWLTALSRNPSAENKYNTVGYIGAGMTEAVAIFALLMGLIIFFVG